MGADTDFSAGDLAPQPAEVRLRFCQALHVLQPIVHRGRLLNMH